MPVKFWNESTPVVVVGATDGDISPTGSGAEQFGSLSEAQAVYPDLDPEKTGARFTWAMRDETLDGTKEAIRFETWAAHEQYSA